MNENNPSERTMRAAYILAMAAMTAACASANATTCKNGGSHWPSCTTPSSQTAPSTSAASSQSSSSASANSGSNASAQVSVAASPTSTSTASGGSVGAVSQSFEEFSRSNMYVLPAPVNAAPLPPGLCPHGDSISWSFGWNFISYARSSTRTELECLDRVLASVRTLPRAEVVQAPPMPPAPPAPACVQPKKRATQKKAAVAADSCKVKP